MDSATLIGFSGFPTFGGTSYAAGDERHRELTGTRRDVAFAEMIEGDSLIAISFFLLAKLAVQTEFRFSAADANDPESVAIAEDWQAMLTGMSTPWGAVVSDAIYGVGWGYSVHEMTWDSRDGRAWLTGLHQLRQDSRYAWHWTDDGRIPTAFEQMTRSGQHATIPLDKCLHFRAVTTTMDPEGKPLLRSVYEDYRALKTISGNMVIGSTKDATGMVKAEVPFSIFASANDTGAADYTAANSMITTIKRDVSALQRGAREGLVVPSEINPDGSSTGFKISLLQGAGQRAFDHLAMAKYFEGREARGLLTQFLLLGTGKTGSFALSADQTELLGVALGGILDDLCDAFNRQVVAHLCDLSGTPPERRPRMVRGDIDKPNLAAVGALLAAATSGGHLTPTPQTEAHLRRLMGFPALDASDEAL